MRMFLRGKEVLLDKVKLNMDYWNKKFAPADSMDALAIKNAFAAEKFSKKQKIMLAEILLATRKRVVTDEDQEEISLITGAFNKNSAVEEMFYPESPFVYCTWRYTYRVFADAIPERWALEAIKNIYARLGVELDTEGAKEVLRADNLYDVFFNLIAEALGNDKYIVADSAKHWNSFAFVAYFNMWHLFGVLGFNGYSPYVICADLGILSPPSSSWKFAKLTEAYAYNIHELKIRARGRSFPTWQQNRFMGIIAELQNNT